MPVQKSLETYWIPHVYIYIYKRDLALNNPQWLICDKVPINHSPNWFKHTHVFGKSDMWKELKEILIKKLIMMKSRGIVTYVLDCDVVYFRISDNTSKISLLREKKTFHMFVYCHPQTDFIMSQIISLARHAKCLKLGSKAGQLYVSLIT